MFGIRYILIAILAATLAACSGADENGSTQPQPVASSVPLSSDTRLAAVLVYAKWCGSCKILDPKLQTAKAEGPIDGLQYFVLDYTDRDEEAFFASADTLGIGAPIRAELGDSVTTGILLLIDIDDGKIVGDLRKKLSPTEIRSAMVEAAASA